MVAAKRKKGGETNPQPMLNLGWDDEPLPELPDEPDAPAKAPEPDDAREQNPPPADQAEEVRTQPVPETADLRPELDAPLGIADEPPEPEPEPEPVPPQAPRRDTNKDREPKAPAVPTDGPVSERLRAARLAAGLSISRVAEETCLRSQFIEALESGRFGDDMLPLVFCRSYVRRLCELYCLPAKETVEAFVKDYEQHKDPRPVSRTFHVAPDGDDGTSKLAYVPREIATEENQKRSVTLGGVLTAVMVFIVIGLSVATVTMLVVRHRNPEKQAQETQTESTDKQSAEHPSSQTAPVDVRKFILPEMLPLDELPIPK